MKNILSILFLLFMLSSCKNDKVLVFTKTDGYRHKSIDTGVKTFIELGNKNNFDVTHTEDSNLFTKENLQTYQLVVFLNTSKNVLNDEQQKQFENFIKNGGSFMGVHAAADTEFDWPWFGNLVGAYFLDHPEKCDATINIADKNHQSTKHLTDPWKRYDEWYNFKTISENINVLLTLDESSYKGGKNGDFHPIAWCQEFDGGRSFYTALGHTAESYLEPAFKQHILGGILYCLNR